MRVTAVRTTGRTGVEMEALTAAAPRLTLYDMVKGSSATSGSRTCACWPSAAAAPRTTSPDERACAGCGWPCSP